MQTNLVKSDFDLLLSAGFGESGDKHRIVDDLVPRLKPYSHGIVATAPLFDPNKSDEKSVAEIISAIKRETVLIGHCAGAIAALMAACRLRFERILKLILVYGPVNPRVDVRPYMPLALPFLQHYGRRDGQLAECRDALSELSRPLIVTIGNQVDKVVPPQSAKLDIDGPEIHLADMSDIPSNHLKAQSTPAMHVVLPFKGHMLRGERLKFLGDVVEDLFLMDSR